MTHESESLRTTSGFFRRVAGTLGTHPREGGSAGISRVPAVVDVMGGIGEDSGSLVLTATAAFSYHVAAWKTTGDVVRVHLYRDGERLEHTMASASISGDAAAMCARCRDEKAEWAAPLMVTLCQAIAESLIPGIEGGLCIVAEGDFASEADLGRRAVLSAGMIDALCRLYGLEIDRFQQSRICASALMHISGLLLQRKVMTALCGPDNNGLLQLRFKPNLFCETLEMPDGLIIKPVATQLSRPTTLRRLIETRTCSEMGHRMIQDIQQRDGIQMDPSSNRLSAITPAEYVERYRDRMPSKITHQAFVNKFGELRGLNDGQENPKAVYKIRSRAEHHIYENRRVHEFATLIVRAKRTGAEDCLVNAGNLMYSSHWSHSQRCGIGGMETDTLVQSIRSHGPDAGLYGAKVTAGGDGGEVVVLMRDNERAHAALNEAIGQSERKSERAVHVFNGSLPGAASFTAPEIDGLLDSVGTA